MPKFSQSAGRCVVRVLVVDDHSRMREAARELIAGMEEFEQVGEAASGEAAVQMAERLRPDLVLLDAGLPGIAGVRVARRLTATMPNAVVVLMSVDPERLSSQAARDCGAATLLDKHELAGATLRDIWSRHRPERREPGPPAASTPR
jgi:DNA-binding NarL/FixJ family response regulator